MSSVPANGCCLCTQRIPQKVWRKSRKSELFNIIHLLGNRSTKRRVKRSVCSSTHCEKIHSLFSEERVNRIPNADGGECLQSKSIKFIQNAVISRIWLEKCKTRALGVTSVCSSVCKWHEYRHNRRKYVKGVERRNAKKTRNEMHPSQTQTNQTTTQMKRLFFAVKELALYT